MAYTFQVTIDSVAPHDLAEWWAEALGWAVEPSDEAFIRRMVDEGRASEEDTTRHRGVLVWKAGAAINHPEPERAPRIFFQGVPEPKTAKNRVHLDVRTGDDYPGSVERLLAHGATKLYDGQQGPHSWVTLTDPEGNELCVSP
jgi:hypothetical protein